MDILALKRCFELSDTMVMQAVASREGTKALLALMARIAQPNEGAPKILLIFARMATSACDWLDGDLRVEVVGDREVSVFEAMTELGGGLRERALPSFALQVPLAEFTRAIERVPRMLEPLILKTNTERRLVLVASAALRARTVPPPHVEIAEDHLIDRTRAPLFFVEPRPSQIVSEAPMPEPVEDPPTEAIDRPAPAIAEEEANVDEGWD